MTAPTTVLGLNRRNVHIARVNDRLPTWLAKDKVATKTRLDHAGIPTAPTLAVLESTRDVRGFAWDELPTGWVMKPSRGSRGLGVWVVTDTKGEGRARRWRVGERWRRRSQIVRGAATITHGDASDTDDDVVLIEPLLESTPALVGLSEVGLPDVRVVCDGRWPLLAMMRIPTIASGGRGNLHQGGVGAAIDLVTGDVTRASWRGKPCTAHPDTGQPIVGLTIPHWREIIDLASRCGAATDLGYVGVDVVIDRHLGPVVLEVNAHPGLEIQNIVQQPLQVS